MTHLNAKFTTKLSKNKQAVLKSSVKKNGAAVISFTSKLQSIKKSREVVLRIRADREVAEDVVVSWETETATQLSGYEKLSGDITIAKGTCP